MRHLVPLSAAAVLLCGAVAVPRAERQAVRFVFTSDAHYGITRTHFRGADDVPATVVNRALVDAVNRTGPLDFVVEGGDVANRAEETELGAIQSAAISWAQFHHDYVDGLTVTDAGGQKAPLYIVPGNHEVSNAIGFYKPMRPPTTHSRFPFASSKKTGAAVTFEPCAPALPVASAAAMAYPIPLLPPETNAQDLSFFITCFAIYIYDHLSGQYPDQECCNF